MDSLANFFSFSLVTLSDGDHITVGQILSVTVFVILASMLGRQVMRVLARHMTQRKVNPNVVQAISKLFFWSLLVLVFITGLGMLRIPITHLAFVGGAIAVGVGFGAQNIINNLISGWILMYEQPIRIGDIVELDDNRGVVEAIGNRSTRIQRIDGVHLLVPNSQLLERVVINWTLRDRRFRTFIKVGVSYGSPVEKVRELILQAAKEQKQVILDPAPLVIFEDFGDNALAFELYFWCEVVDGIELRTIRSAIRFTIDRLFRENGIVIAFPQRDIHLDTSRPLEIRMHKENPE